MKNKKRMKKTMSIVLLLTLFISLFGGMAPGPDSKAVIKVGQIGNIYLKTMGWDARNESYEELTQSTVYENQFFTLYFKRRSGCRIPKGTYIVVTKKNDYNALTSEGYYPWGFPDEYIVRKGTKKKLNYDECSWGLTGIKAGNYVVSLIIPCCSNDGSKTGYTRRTYSLKVYRYG